VESAFSDPPADLHDSPLNGELKNENHTVRDENEEWSSSDDESTNQDEPDMEKLRSNLHVLFLDEFCDMSGTRSTSNNINKMWHKSRKIDLSLRELWTKDRNDFEHKMGTETCEKVDKVVNEWLVWRDMTWKLGTVTRVHPAQGRSLPTFSYQQWVEKLGGRQEFKEMDWRLAKARWHLLKYSSGATRSGFAACLATAFATVIQHRLGVETFKEVYQEDIMNFNEKLFSWTLDFRPQA